MKILIINFSGTGHTTLCGDYIGEAFKELGNEVTRLVVKQGMGNHIDYSQYDLIGFGYPIHAFNPPQFFNNFIKKLPKVENKNYFFFKVSGEPFHLNDASSYHMFKKLKKKGFNLVAEKHFLMPYNIMFRYRDSIAKQMYLYLKPLTKAFVLGIENNEPETIKYRLGHKILSFFLRIEWIAPFCNSPFIKVNRKKCINCLRCWRECPTKAVTINKKGVIKVKATKCAMCMRCAMYCPTDAFTYGFMNPWKVNKPFNYQAIVKNKEIEPEYINHETKGYFKKFNKYFDAQKELLKKYNIPNPIEEYQKQN